MNQTPLVTINLVVYNGEKYLRRCLETVKKQTYPHMEVNVLDNASTDHTAEIVRNSKLEIRNCFFYQSKKNLGMWPGQEKLLERSRGKYIMVLCVDVLLHPEAVARAIAVMEKDEKIGALQGKIYQYNLSQLPADGDQREQEKVIDTVGFKILRNRRVLNIGHGEKDNGQYEQEMEIFAVEGAAPIFRREALESCRINGKIIDDAMFWYGDDLDLAWRMRLLGWKEVYSPQVIMHHDRSTTKGFSRHWRDYLARRRRRQEIPIMKRRLDWRNKRLARLKNDYWSNMRRDWLKILHREVMELGYIILFEPAVLREVFNFVRLIPATLRKRRAVMKRAIVPPIIMQKWFK